MIPTFLRKIKRTLIDSRSIRKYLLFADGEISLVVIGILIALQINNWNSKNKERANEIKIYNEIIDDLVACKNDIENDIIYYEEFIRGTIC